MLIEYSLDSKMKNSCSLKNHPNKVHIIFVLIASIVFSVFAIYAAYATSAKDKKPYAFKKRNIENMTEKKLADRQVVETRNFILSTPK